VWVQGAGFQEDQSESGMIDVAVGFLFCCEDPVLGVYGFCVGCDWFFSLGDRGCTIGTGV
jgi:hypothetical protein